MRWPFLCECVVIRIIYQGYHQYQNKRWLRGRSDGVLCLHPQRRKMCSKQQREMPALEPAEMRCGLVSQKAENADEQLIKQQWVMEGWGGGDERDDDGGLEDREVWRGVIW